MPPLFLRLRRFGRLARVFGVGKAVVSHRRIVAGESNAVFRELGVLKLAPHFQFFFDAGGASFLSGESGCGVPGI